MGCKGGVPHSPLGCKQQARCRSSESVGHVASCPCGSELQDPTACFRTWHLWAVALACSPLAFYSVPAPQSCHLVSEPVCIFPEVSSIYYLSLVGIWSRRGAVQCKLPGSSWPDVLMGFWETCSLSAGSSQGLLGSPVSNKLSLVFIFKMLFFSSDILVEW
jgi:hypothetical protein